MKAVGENKRIKITYCVSDIDKSLAFEWVVTYLDFNRFDLSFILINSHENSYLVEFLKERRIRYLNLTLKRNISYFENIFKAMIFLKKNQTEIIHCHLFKANVIGLTAAKLIGIKKIIHTRHHSDPNHINNKKGVFLDRYFNFISTHIIAISKPVEDILLNWEKNDRSKVVYIPHGFDLKYFKEVNPSILEILKDKYNPRGQYPIIGVIARFIEIKGIQYIIPAFKMLTNTFPDAKLMLFNARGDFEQEIDVLLNEIPEKNIIKVDFEPNLSEVYRLFDIYVHVPCTPVCEAFGQTYIEALACGVPSVFTMSGIADQIIENNINAIVVDYKNSDEIYRAMIYILEKKVSFHMPDLSRFAIEAYISDIESVYND